MKRKLKGKCTTLITYKDGNYELESEYYNHKIKCENKDLQNLLNSSLVYLALTDVNFDNSYSAVISTLFKALYTVKNKKDLKDIESFISKLIGHNEEIDYLLNDYLDVVKINGPDILEMKDTTKEDLINSIDRKRSR